MLKEILQTLLPAVIAISSLVLGYFLSNRSKEKDKRIQNERDMNLALAILYEISLYFENLQHDIEESKKRIRGFSKDFIEQINIPLKKKAGTTFNKGEIENQIILEIEKSDHYLSLIRRAEIDRLKKSMDSLVMRIGENNPTLAAEIQMFVTLNIQVIHLRKNLVEKLTEVLSNIFLKIAPHYSHSPLQPKDLEEIKKTFHSAISVYPIKINYDKILPKVFENINNATSRLEENKRNAHKIPSIRDLILNTQKIISNPNDINQ